MRKYEIAVLSKGAFARTVRIYNPKGADRAVIISDCTKDGNALDDGSILQILKTRKIKNTAAISIDGDASDFLPFDENGEQNKICADYCDYLSGVIIPYLDKRFGFKTYGLLGAYTAGCAALYFASKQNARVSAYALLSAPLFACAAGFDKFLPAASFDSRNAFFVYTGGAERPDGANNDVTDAFIASAFKTVSALRASKVTNVKLRVDGSSNFSDAARSLPTAEFIADFSKY